MKRVLTARFMHETNTFSRRDDRHGDDGAAATSTSKTRSRRRFAAPARRFGATFEAADKYGWTLVHPVSANANPSGIVTDDAFEQIGGDDPRRGRASRARSTACCCICTARWSATAHEDAEGELLARLRRVLGPECRSSSPSTCTPTSRSDGRQCERADRLPHLSAYRPVRARLAGRRAAASARCRARSGRKP